MTAWVAFLLELGGAILFWYTINTVWKRKKKKALGRKIVTFYPGKKKNYF